MKENYVLVAKNLSCNYGKKVIFEGLDFSLEKGKILSILGPNGSGKTSFLKMILGLIKYEGFLELYPNTSVAYVPQVKTANNSFPAKSYELIASSLKKSWPGRVSHKTKNEIKEVLSSIGSEELFEKQLSELSGGELQRVYIARALISKPNLLLLDEPATGIDLICENKINGAIRDINKNDKTGLIMVTHDISAAYDHSDYILMINKRQVYFGIKEDAFTDENLRMTFSTSQHEHHSFTEFIKKK